LTNIYNEIIKVYWVVFVFSSKIYLLAMTKGYSESGADPGILK